jgi:hypothetical protein
MASASRDTASAPRAGLAPIALHASAPTVVPDTASVGPTTLASAMRSGVVPIALRARAPATAPAAAYACEARAIARRASMGLAATFAIARVDARATASATGERCDQRGPTPLPLPPCMDGEIGGVRTHATTESRANVTAHAIVTCGHVAACPQLSGFRPTPRDSAAATTASVGTIVPCACALAAARHTAPA